MVCGTGGRRARRPDSATPVQAIAGPVTAPKNIPAQPAAHLTAGPNVPESHRRVQE